VSPPSKPPHLTAIVPWEGCADNYRDLVAPGGIAQGPFLHFLDFSLRGKTWTESLLQNFLKRPLIDEYWVQAAGLRGYRGACVYWTNLVHTRGTLDAWRKISSRDKWLRVHNTHEWTDLLNPVNVDLRRFFDYFLKGIETAGDRLQLSA
jgi:hypothetical protein